MRPFILKYSSLVFGICIIMELRLSITLVLYKVNRRHKKNIVKNKLNQLHIYDNISMKRFIVGAANHSMI